LNNTATKQGGRKAALAFLNDNGYRTLELAASLATSAVVSSLCSWTTFVSSKPRGRSRHELCRVPIEARRHGHGRHGAWAKAWLHGRRRQRAFGYGNNDNITGWTDASGVHVNAERGGGPGPSYGGTGGVPNTSGVGSLDNPSFTGGSVFGTTSAAPSGYDAQGNPVYGGQPGGFNVPGGIGLGGFGAGSAGGVNAGGGDYFGTQSMRRLLRGGDPSLGFVGAGHGGNYLQWLNGAA